MLADAQVRELVLRFQRQISAVVLRASTASAAAWDSLGSYDEADIVRFSGLVRPVADGAKTASVALSSGFYCTLLQIGARPIKASSIPIVFDPSAGFLAAWHALSEGRPYEEAVAAGRSMTMAATSNSIVSSARRTGDVVATDAGLKVVGWRRVLDGKACHWCQLVSTQRYRTAESADFGHDRCGCTPIPIMGDRDPGRVVNRDLLAELKRSGVVDKISQQQALPRAREALANAQRRVDRLRAELAVEKDQARETRLERRLESARADVARFQARVDDLATQ